MENTEAINKVGLAASPPKKSAWNRYMRRYMYPVVYRVKRRTLSQKVIIANTILIILGATMGLYVEKSYFEGGELGVLLLFVGSGISLSILTNYLVVKLAFRPLDVVTETLRAIRIGHRGIRVPEVNDDAQIEELSRTLNSMLNSLEQQRKKGAASAIKAQEDERKRIARELHDETSQSLTGLVIGIKMAEELVPDDMPDIRDRLFNIKGLAHATLQEVHTMAIRLRPSVLDDLGVTLERHDERIMGAVSDNGCGFDPEAVMLSEEQNRGLGLHGMQERIELVEGSLKIDSRPDEGSSIYLEVPIEAKEGVW
jgi:signal transduction histidine kinase